MIVDIHLSQVQFIPSLLVTPRRLGASENVIIFLLSMKKMALLLEHPVGTEEGFSDLGTINIYYKSRLQFLLC